MGGPQRSSAASWPYLMCIPFLKPPFASWLGLQLITALRLGLQRFDRRGQGGDHGSFILRAKELARGRIVQGGTVRIKRMVEGASGSRGQEGSGCRGVQVDNCIWHMRSGPTVDR